MSRDVPPASAVLWPQVLSKLADSPQLKRWLFPEGILTSSYEVLDYDATLILRDAKGKHAVFERTQRIEFQQDGVEAILDTFWGDGVMLTHYEHSAGTVVGSFRDGERRYLLIKLKRRAAKGDRLTFTVTRQVMESFLQDNGWVETTLTHQAAQLQRTVLFPKERPCRAATLHHAGTQQPLPIIHSPRGKTLVQLKIAEPDVGSPYRICWTW